MKWEEMIAQFFNALTKQKMEQAKKLRCGNCKITLGEVLQVGRLGCPECYNIFGSTLRGLVEQIGNNQHVGKRPKGKSIADLEDRMIHAAIDGNDEEAGRLADEIKKLKGQ